MMKEGYISQWFCVVYWGSPGYDLHDKYSEAVNIASLIQHSSASIFRSHIAAMRK